jgi:HEAT repeat protein
MAFTRSFQPGEEFVGMKRVIMAAVTVVAACGTLRADVPKKKDVPKYIKQLKSSPSGKVRAEAAQALGDRGAIRKADVTDAIEPLLNALKNDRVPLVRKAAAEALGKIGPDKNVAVKPLIEALNDKEIEVKIGAANALRMLGPDAKEARPALQKLFKEARMEVMKGGKGKGKKKDKKTQMQRQLARAAGMALRAINGKFKIK